MHVSTASRSAASDATCLNSFFLCAASIIFGSSRCTGVHQLKTAELPGYGSCRNEFTSPAILSILLLRVVSALYVHPACQSSTVAAFDSFILRLRRSLAYLRVAASFTNSLYSSSGTVERTFVIETWPLHRSIACLSHVLAQPNHIHAKTLELEKTCTQVRTHLHHAQHNPRT